MNIDNFAEEIAKALEEYSEEVDGVMQEAIEETAKEAVSLLKNHPKIPTKTGEYKKSFYLKRLAQGKGYKRVVIANKKYQLTHLLEKGHAIKGGTKRVKDYPHWKDAEEFASNELNKKLREKLS